VPRLRGKGRERVRAAALVLAAAAIATGCGGGGGDGDTSDAVVAGFYPLAFAGQEIGGPSLDVEDLTPAGTEPHDLELTPRAVERLKSARLVLLMGGDFQPQLEEAAGRDERVLRLIGTPGLRVSADDDPHVWLDPLRYAVIARRIGVALGRRRAAEEFVARLRGLDREYRRRLASCSRRELVTSHRAFGYLTRRYRLRQVGITGLSPEAEPRPRDLQRVAQTVRRTGATTVFTETLVSPRVANTLARETGARTETLDPIEGLRPAALRSGEDYFTVMRSNLMRLRAALDCG
jgi:zinc transport system substrate-binding protein